MNWGEACNAMLDGKTVKYFDPCFYEDFVFYLRSGYLVRNDSNTVLMTEDMFRATNWQIVKEIDS